MADLSYLGGYNLVLSELLSTVRGSLDSLVHDLLQAGVLKADKSSMGSTVRACDVLSQLGRLIR